VTTEDTASTEPTEPTQPDFPHRSPRTAHTQEEDAAITQLQTQTMYLTQALKAACEGRWQGADSVEAWLLALNPALAGQIIANPPVYPDA